MLRIQLVCPYPVQPGSISASSEEFRGVLGDRAFLSLRGFPRLVHRFSADFISRLGKCPLPYKFGFGGEDELKVLVEQVRAQLEWRAMSSVKAEFFLIGAGVGEDFQMPWLGFETCVLRNRLHDSANSVGFLRNRIVLQL
ncbi:hypothetical protein H6F89_31570 [Cyanobacteria bacterium FACHB-63]|nr:hypothetical protein [Cyanobacteria bacterium FACHB-63]